MLSFYQVEQYVVLDTSFAIALSSLTARNHVRAIQFANELEANRTCLVTTQAILLEIGNALSKQKYRMAAIQLLESLEADSTVEVVLLTKDLYNVVRGCPHPQKECLRGKLPPQNLRPWRGGAGSEGDGTKWNRQLTCWHILIFDVLF